MVSDRPSSPSAEQVLVSLVMDWTRDKGLRAADVLAEAGLGDGPASAGPVPPKKLAALLDAAARMLGDEYFGLHLALAFDPRQLGTFHYVLASAPTLGEALAGAARYNAAAPDAIRPRYRRTAESLLLAFEFGDAERHRDRQLTEFWAAILLREFRSLTGLDLKPARTSFVHQRAQPSDEMRHFFGATIQFGAEEDCLAFDPRAGDLPIVSADPFLQQLLLQQVETAVDARAGGPGDFRSRVENAVSPRLAHGGVAIHAVAKDLGMSTRTLSRRLADEGLTFSRVLAELRAELALKYLGDASLPVSRIAWLLGYGEASAFVVAFRRWTGMSPGEARAGLLRDDGP